MQSQPNISVMDVINLWLFGWLFNKHKVIAPHDHGPQTQLRVESALRISKLMTRLHFSQFLWNVIFPKFLGQALPYWSIVAVSGIRKKKTTLKEMTFTEKNVETFRVFPKIIRFFSIFIWLGKQIVRYIILTE